MKPRRCCMCKRKYPDKWRRKWYCGYCKAEILANEERCVAEIKASEEQRKRLREVNRRMKAAIAKAERDPRAWKRVYRTQLEVSE